MDNRPLLPPPLMKQAHIAPFDGIIRNFVGLDSDVTGEDVLWYYASVLNFDTVPAVLLPTLAKMFGVEAHKGFDYADTEAKKRTTLKNSLLMKRKHGTAWSVRTALENAGFLNVKIIEHLSPVIFWDGTYQFDGTIQFNSAHWAHFKVEMEPPVGVLAEDVDVERLMLLINYWKRKCTLCVGVTISQLVITDFGIGDDASILWDGSIQFDGSAQFTG